MKLMYRGTLLSAALLSIGTAFAAPPTSLQMSTRMTTNMQGQPPHTVNGTVWIKNGKLRVETGEMIQIIDNKEVMVVNTKDPQKVYQAFPLPANQKATTTAERMKLSFPAKGLKKVGTASMLGHPTTIYEVDMPGAGNNKPKVWLSEDMGLPIPLKMQITGPFTQINEVTSLKVNPVIADSLFVVPAGYKRHVSPTPPTPGASGGPHT